MVELQKVLKEAPDYANRLTGHPPGRADAHSIGLILPEGKAYADKFL